MTVKERVGSNWKEVINYGYNKDEQLTKLIKQRGEWESDKNGHDYV
jgi:hypothetical protein